MRPDYIGITIARDTGSMENRLPRSILVETALRKCAVEKDGIVKHMKNILILKPIRNARKAAGVALVAM